MSEDTERSSLPAVSDSSSHDLVVSRESTVLGIDKFRDAMREKARLILPYLKLAQPMTKEVQDRQVEAGQYINSLTGEVYGGEFEILPLGYFHWRRLFDEERTVQCASNDAITGYGDPGGLCRNCFFSWWHVERNGLPKMKIDNIGTFRSKKEDKLIAPPCNEQHVFVVMILQAQLAVPSALVFQRTSFGLGERFGSLVAMAPSDTVYRLYTSKQESKKGTWWLPQFKMARRATADEIAEMLKIRTSISNAEVEVDETAAAADDGKVPF